VRDVFVCTHGSRDRCCARFGYPLYEALLALAAGARGLRVWRTSHTGGHRFAPTMIEMPAGRYWGHLDGTTATAIATRRGPVAGLLACYRGRALVAPLAQIVEAELFGRHGWDWDRVAVDADVEPRAWSAGGAVEAALVRVRYAAAGGAEQAAVRRVIADGVVRTGGCGKPAGTEPRYRAVDAEADGG
jgi:hypothetical protein